MNEYLAALQGRGLHSVYILDRIAGDVEPTGFVSERLRVANVRNLQTVYELMAQATQTVRDEAAET